MPTSYRQLQRNSQRKANEKLQKHNRQRAVQYAAQLAALIESACEHLEIVVPERAQVTRLLANVRPRIALQHGLTDDLAERRDQLSECIDRLLKIERLTKRKGPNGRYTWTDREKHAEFRAADGAIIGVIIRWQSSTDQQSTSAPRPRTSKYPD